LSNNNFNFRLIKARVAETIIKELFLDCGYQVYENGIERTMPLLMDKIKSENSEIAEHIRFSPDFVVQNNETGELFYLEVKYRKNGNFNINDLPEKFPYKNAYFIVVSKSDIQWISYELLQKGQYLSQNSRMFLENCNIFNLNIDKVLAYKKYAQDFFSNVE
jgi:hypothetical protein